MSFRRSWQNTDVSVKEFSHVHRLMSPSLNAYVRPDRFSCVLPRCYRNTPTQEHPTRDRLLRFLVFLLRFMLLGWLSVVNRATINQRAVGCSPLEGEGPGFESSPVSYSSFSGVQRKGPAATCDIRAAQTVRANVARAHRRYPWIEMFEFSCFHSRGIMQAVSARTSCCFSQCLFVVAD